MTGTANMPSPNPTVPTTMEPAKIARTAVMIWTGSSNRGLPGTGLRHGLTRKHARATLMVDGHLPVYQDERDPGGNWRGSSYVAVSMMRSASNRAMSAK